MYCRVLVDLDPWSTISGFGSGLGSGLESRWKNRGETIAAVNPFRTRTDVFGDNINRLCAGYCLQSSNGAMIHYFLKPGPFYTPNLEHDLIMDLASRRFADLLGRTTFTDSWGYESIRAAVSYRIQMQERQVTTRNISSRCRCRDVDFVFPRFT